MGDDKVIVILTQTIAKFMSLTEWLRSAYE